MELKNKSNGITLIALVITIIILLILAGVSIAMLTGENGILTQATRARDASERASIIEQIQLDILEIQADKDHRGNISDSELEGILDKYGEIQYEEDGTTIKGIKTDKGGYEILLSDVWSGTTVADVPEEIMDENGIYLKTTTINGEEGNHLNPTIPAGFKTVDTTDATWGDGSSAPSSTAVNEGLVIEDEDGNQFVWVPVDGTTIKYAKHAYATPSTTDTSGSTEDGTGWRTYYYRNYGDWTDTTAEGNEASVSEHGGFYVARYEAGVPSDANFYAVNGGETYYKADTTPSKNVTTYTPVSKANNQSWSYISQENAITVAANMYKDNSEVKSQLIDSWSWDAITTWMNNEISGIANDSTNYGNYYNRAAFSVTNTLYAQHTNNNGWTPAATYSKGTPTSPGGSGTGRLELPTGVTPNAEIKNIYDFAGNMYEWTTETGYHGAGSSGTKYAVLRGGCFSDFGTDVPVSFRHGYYTTTYTHFDFGFRVAIYL